MNNHNNPKKRRRLSGCEDAPGVVTQGPSSASAVYSPPVRRYEEWELQILQAAASIVSCHVSDITALDRYPHRQPHHHHQQQQQQQQQRPSDPPPSKRLRVDTDLSPMSAHVKTQPGLPATGTYDRSPRPSDDGVGFSYGGRCSRVTSCLAVFCPPCTTSEPSDYSGAPTTTTTKTSSSTYGYEAKPALLSGGVAASPNQPWSLSQPQAGIFAYDDSPSNAYLPEYPALQPTRTQPSTRNEEMSYQIPPSDRKYPSRPDDGRIDSHVADSRDFGYHQPAYVSPRDDSRRYSSSVGFLPPDGDEARMARQTANLDIVSSHQRAQPSKRGPFKSHAERERTAETRKIGSCIRCRMQRIRCEINPDDKGGTCLTCSRVTTTKSYRLPCLRYKITDVRLFKPGNVKGHEWTRRWTEGIADDISNWASVETRTVRVTEGYGSRPVELRVREFIPQDGDKLDRTWVHKGSTRSVRIPAYAIVNLDEAKAIYTNHINEELKECCRRVVDGKHKLIRGTYGFAMNLMLDGSTDQKERELLSKAFRLWMAIRMTTRSTLIVGDERLGMTSDIMDETSPLKGQIPLPPVMGAQIELVLIHQLQTKWRREMLDQLQNMTQANNHSTWLTIYLVTFILLHNVSLLCQHDAAYALKHGIKDRDGKQTEKHALAWTGGLIADHTRTPLRCERSARLTPVSGAVCQKGHGQGVSTSSGKVHGLTPLPAGANILLAYFHYCNKGIYPFSMECSDQDLSTLAKLDPAKVKFVQGTRAIIHEQRKHWQKVRESNGYENDMYFISQLFEEKWEPQPPMV
ncbi:tetratricopeptide repeat domain containing protein [Seiridium cupressi]